MSDNEKHPAILLLEKIVRCEEGAGPTCPVCHTYTHKAWCWWPEAVELAGEAAGVELNGHDRGFLENRGKV